MPAPLTGQVAITGSAQALSASPITCQAFTIKAPVANANPVYIGASGVTTGTGYQLDPGDDFEYQRLSLQGQARYELSPSDFFAVGTAGSDKVTWFASP